MDSIRRLDEGLRPISWLQLALKKRGRPVIGSRILLLGLAYKKNTGDARNSPAIRVAELLLRMGAEVRAADPLVTEPTLISPAVARVDATPEEIAAADMVILLTDHEVITAADVARHAPHFPTCLDQSIVQPLMTAFSVVMAHEALGGAPQRRLPKEDHSVQTFRA